MILERRLAQLEEHMQQCLRAADERQQANAEALAEARERIARCNQLFQETVLSLLSLVRPLSFTQA